MRMEKGITDEEIFKQQFIATFCATWAASKYEMACMTGDHKKLHEPPYEDAVFLAEKHWEHIQKLKS